MPPSLSQLPKISPPALFVPPIFKILNSETYRYLKNAWIVMTCKVYATESNLPVLVPHLILSIPDNTSGRYARQWHSGQPSRSLGIRFAPSALTTHQIFLTPKNTPSEIQMRTMFWYRYYAAFMITLTMQPNTVITVKTRRSGLRNKLEYAQSDIRNVNLPSKWSTR